MSQHLGPDPGPNDPAARLAWRHRNGQAALRRLLPGLRAHRLQECPSFPLCPGPEIADMIERQSPEDWLDFLLSALHGCADRDVEIENARARYDRLAERLASTVGELDAAKREADAGWAAYQQVKQGGKP